MSFNLGILLKFGVILFVLQFKFDVYLYIDNYTKIIIPLIFISTLALLNGIRNIVINIK